MKKVPSVKVPKVKAVPYKKPFGMGANGPEVEYLCFLLQGKGSKVKLTEKFHVGVRSAVICFQKKNNLKPTGVVDKKTWDKLQK